jgi:N-acetylglucosamine-6-sulfatase
LHETFSVSDGGVVRRAPSLLLCVTVLACTAQPRDPSLFQREQAAKRPAPPPNILVIVTDDQTVGTWRAMPRTTHRIVRRGVEFTQAFASNPMCCPSRAAILTGGFSTHSGVYSNGGRYGGMRAFHEHGDERRTLAALLDPTYETALFGKYLNGYASYAQTQLTGGYVPPGWDEWQVQYENNGAYYDYRLNVNGKIVRYGHDPQDYSPEVIGTRLRDWLDPRDGDGRDPKQPFFAMFTPFAPHGPPTPSARFGDDRRFSNLPAYTSPAMNEIDVSDKPAYIRRLPLLGPDRLASDQVLQQRPLEALYSLDRQIGLTLDLLKREGELHDTMIVVVSDNGTTTGEHRWTYKLVPYERSIRVPMAIRYDRLTHAPRVERRQLVTTADVFSTVMAVARPRWVAHRPIDGVSLTGVLAAPQRRPVRTGVLLQNLYMDRVGQPDVPTYCGIRTRRWKYVVYSPTRHDPSLVDGRQDVELYDLRRDPYELHNIAERRPHVARRLRSDLPTMCRPAPPGWSVRW